MSTYTGFGFHTFDDLPSGGEPGDTLVIGPGGNLEWDEVTGGPGGSVGNPTAMVGLTAINGVATSAMRSDGAPALNMSISPVWAGDHTFLGTVSVVGATTFSKAGAANTPAVRLTGLPFAGGTATTTKPLLLLEPTGTTSDAWATLGTMFGVNAAAGFAGNLIDAQLAGVKQFRLYNASSATYITLADHLGTIRAYPLAFGSQPLYIDCVGGLAIASPTEPSLKMGNASDVTLNRFGPAHLRLGSFPSATPLAQTFTLGEASRPGTDSNVAGASGTIQSGLGTGTGAASSLIFQTPDVAAAGSGVQTYVTRLTLGSTSTFTGHVFFTPTGVSDIGDLFNRPRHVYSTYIDTVEANITGAVKFPVVATELQSPASGRLYITNFANNGADGISFGAETAAWPRFKISGTTIQVRLGDNSGDATLTAANIPLSKAGYLSSNQPTTSATAVDVTGFSFAIAAGEIWSFQFYTILACSATGANVRFAVNAPAGATVGAQVRGSVSQVLITALNTLAAGCMNATTGSAFVSGVVVNSSTAGTVQLRFASGDGIATATITGLGSYFVARKMN